MKALYLTAKAKIIECELLVTTLLTAAPKEHTGVNGMKQTGAEQKGEDFDADNDLKDMMKCWRLKKMNKEKKSRKNQQRSRLIVKLQL